VGKTLFRGQRRLIDQATGEIIETQVVERSVAGGDVGFHKIWLGHILELVEECGNAKMQVLVWLLRQADAQNQIAASTRQIADGSGVGIATANRLMRALQRVNVITRNGRYGLWRLNPDVIFRGDYQKRMNVLIRYRDESQASLPFDGVEESAPSPTENVTPIRRAA
jgi:hypothetical protein